MFDFMFKKYKFFTVWKVASVKACSATSFMSNLLPSYAEAIQSSLPQENGHGRSNPHLNLDHGRSNPHLNPDHGHSNPHLIWNNQNVNAYLTPNLNVNGYPDTNNRQSHPQGYSNYNGQFPPQGYPNFNGQFPPQLYPNYNGQFPPQGYPNYNGQFPPQLYPNSNGHPHPNPTIYANQPGMHVSSYPNTQLESHPDSKLIAKPPAENQQPPNETVTSRECCDCLFVGCHCCVCLFEVFRCISYLSRD